MPVLHRTISALLVTLGLAATLTACASSGAGTTPSSCFRPGAASEAVTATGAFGTEPDVSVPKGLTVDGTQVSVLRKGTGRVIGAGTPAILAVTTVDGENGRVTGTTGYSGITAPVTAGAANYGVLGKAIECARVGDRLAVALPASETKQGATGDATSDGTVPAGVYVIDVKQAFDARATGTPQLAGDRMPAVVLAPSGAPGITIPSWSAPKSDETHLLRKGSGARLSDDDYVVVKLVGVTWSSDPSVIGSSWTDGSGSTVLSLAKGQVPEAVRTALLGHRVGDQVLAVVHEQGAADVYVFDVLGKISR